MALNLSLTPIQVGYANEDRFVAEPTVTNTDDSEVTATVTMDVAGTQEDSRDVTFGARESKRVGLVWEVDVGSDQVLTVTFNTPDDTLSEDVTFRVYDDFIQTDIGRTNFNEEYVQDAGR